MKTKFIALPLLLLFATTSCNQGASPEAKDGKLPEGGSEITEPTSKTDALKSTLSKTRTALANLNDAGLTLSSNGLSMNLASEKVNGDITIGNFTLTAGGTNLANGTKDTTRVGLDFSGLKNNLDITKTVDGSSSIMQEENNLGKFAVYLDKGNIYADLSEFGAPELINNAAIKLEPYVSMISEIEIIPAEMVDMIETFVSTLAESPRQVSTTVGLLFGTIANFNWKMEFDGVLKDANYPLVNVNDVLPAEVDDEAISSIKVNFNETFGLNFDDTVKFYTYKDEALGIQVDINKDQLKTVLDKYIATDFEYVINDGSLKFAVYFDETGVPSSLSMVNAMDLTLSGEPVEEMFGETCRVKTNFDLNLNLKVGSNPVSFPANYDDYNAFIGLN